MTSLACRHCARRKVNRPRGLCWDCYYTVRDLYPSTSKYARRGTGNLSGGYALPAEPTDAAPGTAEKMAVLAARAAAGVALFHPADRLDVPDTNPKEATVLVLTRRLNDEILIGDGPNRIRIVVMELGRGEVRLAVDAPRTTPIYRGELPEQAKAHLAARAAEEGEPDAK